MAPAIPLVTSSGAVSWGVRALPSPLSVLVAFVAALPTFWIACPRFESIGAAMTREHHGRPGRGGTTRRSLSVRQAGPLPKGLGSGVPLVERGGGRVKPRPVE